MNQKHHEDYNDIYEDIWIKQKGKSPSEKLFEDSDFEIDSSDGENFTYDKYNSSVASYCLRISRKQYNEGQIQELQRGGAWLSILSQC
jgi:hypothetical protein